MIGGLTQLVMGVVRPHPPHKGEAKSVARWIFEILHRVVGFGSVVVAILAMLGGIKKALELGHIEQVTTWNTHVIAPIATTAGLGLALTVYINACHAKAEVPANGKKALDAEQPLNVAKETELPELPEVVSAADDEPKVSPVGTAPPETPQGAAGRASSMNDVSISPI
mmetsp:Transcript_1996/g.6613  ORF Transcript_1996/g.6613 Transcript_1996/m.6613 type:complete len:168 (-) Transcript_1996:150-653(-)